MHKFTKSYNEKLNSKKNHCLILFFSLAYHVTFYANTTFWTIQYVKLNDDNTDTIPEKD